ncbi:MAG: hypothetical protein ACK4NS_13885, partial [Saprospiraceae bacterium]
LCPRAAHILLFGKKVAGMGETIAATPARRFHLRNAGPFICILGAKLKKIALLGVAHCNLQRVFTKLKSKHRY